MQFIDYYKALVLREYRNHGSLIYMFIGVDEWNKPAFHYTSKPNLLPVTTTMEDIIKDFQARADDEFIKQYYSSHILIDATLTTTDLAV